MVLEIKDYSYEWFMKYSLEMNKNEIKLPDETAQLMSSIKKRLNIKKDSFNFKNESKLGNTEIKKDNVLCNIYKILNKISSKTYDTMSEELVKTINDIDETNLELKEQVSKKMFDIISNTPICCKLYANLYNRLIEEDDMFKKIFTDNVDIYLNNFKTIMHDTSIENYDEYCLYIKHIVKLKNFTLFMIQCMYFGICDISYIIDALIYLQNRLLITIKNEEQILENEQAIDTICIIIKETKDLLFFNERWSIIEKNHKELCNYTGPGKNNKIKFKMMDIEDSINK